MERYTQEQLHEAFDLVKDRDNWKMPVDTVIPYGSDTDVITSAVIHFTGSVPSFITLNDGSLRVYAAGYYACIGS